MSSEELVHKSIRLLDDAVGSPSSYHRSPMIRQNRPRSSLFSNTLLPLRHSDVREFAQNTSLTMSTSELENYMIDTSSLTAHGIAEQHTIIKDASDSLYQTFLESMQAHSSSQEVFDTIAEFVQNCNNVLDIMKETHNAKDLAWLEFERNNWRLLQCLYQNRLMGDDPMEVGAKDADEDMAADVVRSPSEKEIMENFFKTSTKIREYQTVVDWLEKNAADRLDTRGEPKLFHYMDNTVAWENTLHQKQNENTVSFRSRHHEIVSSLDPDAPQREQKPLHDLDMEDEARLLKHVFVELRCGRLVQAIAACHHCGQSWRAATLEGWRLHHDPNYTTRLSITEKLPVEGNPHRDIWKLCAWRLSSESKASEYARAVHGALCGNVNAVLPVCKTWDDILWAYTRALVDQLVEREIRDNSLREYVPMPDAYWNNKLSMEEAFTRLASFSDSAVERRLQQLMILDQLPQLLNEVLAWAQRADCSSQVRRFLAHLILTFRLLGQPASQEIGDEIVKIYVKELMEQKEPELVAYYTATLPVEDQVSLYAQFLQHIDQSELRRVALDAAEAVQLPVESITKRVVENIRNEEGARHERELSELMLSTTVTDEDRRKISALEWVVLYPSQRAEALWQTNALIRTFLALGKTQAARLAFNQIPSDSIDKVLTQYQAEPEEDMVIDYSDCLPSRVAAAVQEYLSHKAYLDAQEGFADWFEHYHHSRPVEPTKPGPAASFSEKVAYDHRLASYNKDLDRWRAALDHQTKCVKQQLYNVLLFPRGGWLADSDEGDRLRSHQMKSLRTLCIPNIVLLLHTVLHSTGLYKEAIQLADVIIDESQAIYKVYSKQRIGELLSKIRESSLASLTQGKDPWGHVVSS